MQHEANKATRAHTSLVVARILDEVVLQHAHEDGGQETREQQHRHAAVDDGEPVDLRADSQGKHQVPMPCPAALPCRSKPADGASSK